jgi:CelD/BcsL family acetyltransferase involved in cellulose biosynthesis
MSAITVEEICSEEALARLAPEWRALSESADGALLFNTYDWASACWRHFHAVHAAAQLWVLAVRNGTSLRGIVPLWVETRVFLGLPTRILHFLGEGPSDYGDLLLASPCGAALDAVLAHLAARRDRWDLMELRELCADSRNVEQLISAMAARGWWMERTEDSRCEQIPVTDGWDAYYERRFRGKRRKDMRRQWRNLEVAGAVRTEIISRVPDCNDLVQSFAEIQAAHAAAGELRPGEFNDPIFRPFLDSMLRVASEKGWLRLALLRLDNVPVAYYLAFLFRGRYYVYNTAHRADSQSLGTGRLLMLYMLERFFDEAGGVIDYLRGAEEYKKSWTERSMVNHRLRAASSGVRAVAGRLVWFRLVPALQQRSPLLYRVLSIASEEGPRGVAARVLGRMRGMRHGHV